MILWPAFFTAAEDTPTAAVVEGVFELTEHVVETGVRDLPSIAPEKLQRCSHFYGTEI